MHPETNQLCRIPPLCITGPQAKVPVGVSGRQTMIICLCPSAKRSEKRVGASVWLLPRLRNQVPQNKREAQMAGDRKERQTHNSERRLDHKPPLR